MEPEETKTESAAPEETSSVVVVEPESQHLPTQDQAPKLKGVLPIVLLALLVSLLLRRISPSAVARPLRRWLPLLYTLTWGAAIIVVTGMYARGLPNTWLLGIWLLFLVVAFASVGWLRGVMSGVALSVEGKIRLGDSIRFGDVEGEVVAFGMRAMRIRAVDGTIHELPNEKLVTEPVANLTGDGGDSACELTISVPPTLDPDDAVELAQTVAILTPLASPRHQPEVFLVPREHEDDRYDVRVRGYVCDASYQDHFRSDVVSRLQAAFAELTDARTATHETANKLLISGED